MNKLWQDIQYSLQGKCNESELRMLQTVSLQSFTDNVLRIIVSSEFLKEWIQTKFEPIIVQFLQCKYKLSISINYVIEEQSFNNKTSKKSADLDIAVRNSFLVAGYTFDQFVEGPSNLFAKNAAMAVSKTRDGNFNPLYIYANHGLGKTHLVHAIGHQLKINFPDHRIQIVAAKQFANDLINAIKEKQTAHFRKVYRRIDILIIEDVEFLKNKIQTQEEFFHTFDELKNKQKLIVLTANAAPQFLKGIDNRLTSRFAGGLVVNIQPPELATRMQILWLKAKQRKLLIPDAVLELIAEKITANIQDMESALNRIVAHTSFLKTDITVELAQKIVQSMLSDLSIERLDVSEIKKHTAAYFNLKESDLNSTSKKPLISRARQVAIYLARELTTDSLVKIGDSFNRDHSTIIKALNKIKQESQIDDKLAQQLEELKLEFKS